MLVDSCLHCLLFKNEKVSLFLRPTVSPTSMIKQACKLGVVSPCWMQIPAQNIITGLIHLVATIRSFKMLIDNTLDLPLPSSAPFKRFPIDYIGTP